MTFCQPIINNRRVESGEENVLSCMKKLLCHAILATLGVGSLVTGLQQSVYGAGLTVLSQPESGLSVRSGESLIGLESRSYLNDYLTLFPETKPLTEEAPISVSHPTESPVVQVPTVILDLIKSVEVNTGGSSLNSDQLLEVRYRMDLS
ncbi:hypothetical protein [Allocoleopsis sp.]|uniref:hypothetical protein n=1 Tax=Allocoleopsis sp. TaxID=3088169 RepID=UPI002FCF4880